MRKPLYTAIGLASFVAICSSQTKTTPTISSAPTASVITYGQTLEDSTLMGGLVTGFTTNKIVCTVAWAGDGYLDGPVNASVFHDPYGAATDTSGNIYVADAGNHRIRKITPAGVVTTLAGSGTAGFADGVGTAAKFNSPRGVAVDASGNIYVGDFENHRIRKITPAGVVTTLAGSGVAGFADGSSGAARFNGPVGVAVDANRNVYVAEYYNSRIRKITATGVVTTLAGGGNYSFADGTGTNARFYLPTGVAVDSSGNVYVADSLNFRIRKVTPAGVVTTLAGGGSSFVDGAVGTAAQFAHPTGIAVDFSGNLYVADRSRIRKITSTGVVTTLAGGGTSPVYSVDGTGAAAVFNDAYSVGVDASGNIYAAEIGRHLIRKVTPAGVVTTLAGSGIAGFADGSGAAARFNSPQNLVVDSYGNIYVTDGSNHLIRKVTPEGIVTTVAGSRGLVANGSYVGGFADGTGPAAQFNRPTGLAADSSGNLYVADCSNQRIRKVTPAGVVTTLAGGGNSFVDGAVGTAAKFLGPNGVAVDASGNVYVGDNTAIRKVTPAGVVTTLAGGGNSFVDGAVGTAAQFYHATGVAVDASGNVYVGDNTAIRKVTPAGVVTTLAGSGIAGFADGTGAEAQFCGNAPIGVAVDASGNVYVADFGNVRVRKVTPAGVVTTLAGNGNRGFADGTAVEAQFDYPAGVAVDAYGDVYVADCNNRRIRLVTSAGGSFAFTTPSIKPDAGTSSYSVTFIPNDLTNYNMVTTSVSVTVSKATPVISNVPTARPIVVGQALSNSVLSNGVASVPGTWAWTSPTNRPGSGTSLQPVNFTPTASNNFNTVTTNVSLTVNLSTTLITRVPNPGPITFGQALSNSVLSNGLASVPGSWAWQSPTNLPNAGSNRPNIIFTPSNTTTHSSVTTNLVLVVNKATPSITWTSPATIAFGTALSSTQLSATSPVAGTYTYLPTNGSVLNAGTNNMVLTFRAADSNNYATPVSRTNFLVVTKATPVISNLPVASAISFGQALSNSVLSGGSNAVRGKWGWVMPSNRPSAVGTNNFSIIFTPSNNLNLNQVTSNVSLIINQATPVITRMPTASPIAYGQSLSNSILSNGVASVPGAFMWTSPTNRPSAGTNMQGITFIPSDTNNVRSIFTNVPLVVTQVVVNPAFGSATQSISTVNGFVASFKRVGSLRIGFSPSPGQVLKLINNTSSSEVVGEFDGLPEGASMMAAYGGNTFYFRISYTGGDGNDITLRRIGGPGQQEGYIVTTFAGSGGYGLTNGVGTNASIGGPSGIAVDGLGYVYVSSGSVIRKITPSGEVTTLAGSGFPGTDDGPGNTARFDTPKGLAVDQNGNVYVADWYNQRIRKVTTDGFVSTLAGQRREGFIDGTGTNASFYYPSGLALDSVGNIYVAEQGNHAVRKVTADGVVTTLAGSGVAGFTNGEGTSASFNYPTGVSVDNAGNAYIGDQLNDRIRKISPSGVVTTFAGASSGSYWDDMATNASFSFPSGVACDSAGNLYIADENGNRICKIDSNGRFRTIAGLGNGFGYADGYGTDAKFAHPSAIAIDRSGIIYVADTLNHRIRKISATNEYRPIFTAYNWSTLIGQNDQQLAKVNPNGFATTVKFFYGTNSNNMNLLATLPIAPSNGTVPLTVTSPVVRLTQGITNYYRFTASNVDGLSVTPVLVSLLPYTNATLTKLVTSSGSLNPVFSTSVTNYTLSVSNTNSSLQITPTLAGPYSWVSVFGTNIPSGTVSGPIPLEVGTNAISIYVNAQNRVTTGIYKLKVIRAASP